MQTIMEVTEHQIVPGETARFPFIMPAGEGHPSLNFMLSRITRISTLDGPT